MKNTVLITGASNGIGLELAKVHAAKGGDLVLIARNKTKLDELKTELENQYKIFGLYHWQRFISHQCSTRGL